MSEPRRLVRDGAEIVVFDDAGALVEAAARELEERMRSGFSIALAGGSTPADLYRTIARTSVTGAWDHAHVWFGDERCVPPDHADSNYRMARETLLDPLRVPADHVHRMRGELPPPEAARRYADELHAHFGGVLPRFDLVLLGIGEDGHTASLFPGTAALGERTAWVAANWVEKLASHRITLTYPVLRNAAAVWIFAVGGRKAEILAQVLDGSRDPARHPVQGVRLAEQPVRWWLDAAAAAALA